jgi:hypothetical protein
MPRLDNDVGTGVHLTPTGVEFDERRLTLGNSTEVSRGGGGGGRQLLGLTCNNQGYAPSKHTAFHILYTASASWH